MKKLTLCTIVMSTIFLSACADMMHAKNNNNKAVFDAEVSMLR
jgi:hypothetical protein